MNTSVCCEVVNQDLHGQQGSTYDTNRFGRKVIQNQLEMLKLEAINETLSSAQRNPVLGRMSLEELMEEAQKFRLKRGLMKQRSVCSKSNHNSFGLC